MLKYLVALHVTAVCLVVGVLFVQSLAVVMAMRLKTDAQREGQRILQQRFHWFIYYPILAVALGTGFWLASAMDAFAQGKWLAWKLVGVMMLIGLGFLTGWEIRTGRVPKPVAMLVHIAIFLVSLWIVYLATARPF
jgi:uncharacterized membrane protein